MAVGGTPVPTPVESSEGSRALSLTLAALAVVSFVASLGLLHRILSPPPPDLPRDTVAGVADIVFDPVVIRGNVRWMAQVKYTAPGHHAMRLVARVPAGTAAGDTVFVHFEPNDPAVAHVVDIAPTSPTKVEIEGFLITFAAAIILAFFAALHHPGRRRRRRGRDTTDAPVSGT